MLRLQTLLLLALLPTHSLAASQALDCKSRDLSVVISAGNSENQGAKIKFIDQRGKPGIYAVPANILPEFDFSAPNNAKAVTAIPVSSKTNVEIHHETMRIKRKNGTECYGQERWHDRYTQTYVITGKNDLPLNTTGALYGKRVKGMNAKGFIVVTLNCLSHGISTAGGCFVENDSDVVEWVKQK